METILWIVIILLLIGFGIVVYLVRSHYEQRLKKEVYTAQKSEQLKSVFLDNASHALRTPLNAILGYSNLILEEKDDAMDAIQVKQMAAHINKN